MRTRLDSFLGRAGPRPTVDAISLEELLADADDDVEAPEVPSGLSNAAHRAVFGVWTISRRCRREDCDVFATFNDRDGLNYYRGCVIVPRTPAAKLAMAVRLNNIADRMDDADDVDLSLLEEPDKMVAVAVWGIGPGHISAFF